MLLIFSAMPSKIINETFTVINEFTEEPAVNYTQPITEAESSVTGRN